MNKNKKLKKEKLPLKLRDKEKPISWGKKKGWIFQEKLLDIMILNEL
jgi:hypothetical protein